jgi:hypothetical protein
MNVLILNEQYLIYMKAAFEKKIIELGFSYQCNTDGIYNLYKNNVANSNLKAQLICSRPVDESKLGSRNGNLIQSIGYFKFNLPTEAKDKDFSILSFQNTNNHCVDFLIIPRIELIEKLKKKYRTSTDSREIEMVFWLMPDNHLYECSEISVEGEWYFLSKGVNSRMADGSEWDYSKFLNTWDGLKRL